MANLALCLLWHQHQPLYRDLGVEAKGAYRLPWVRLHALRDYYSMAALATELETVRVTINLTPVLAWQLNDYAEGGGTDRALELTLKRAESLTTDERQEVLASFFGAEPRTQIARWPRYAELSKLRNEHHAFGVDDLRDLQAWFSLCWFGQEFQTSDVRLVTGETVSVRRFIEQGEHFAHSDLEAIVAEQYKVLRAVLPFHRSLQDAGKIEVSTTPFYHPILPLLLDSGPAGPVPHLSRPDDAEAQIRLAVTYYEQVFGQRPRGMWPAEGAVNPAALAVLAAHNLQWIATDQSVLGRSGRWGYRDDDPNTLCRPYRGEGTAGELALFFRERELSNSIGFRYHAYADADQAARDFVNQIHARISSRLDRRQDHVLTVALDGENPWGGYADGGREFLRALYRRLAADAEVATSTFSGYLNGDGSSGQRAHPTTEQERVYELHAGSWVDDPAAPRDAAFATWIGDPDENHAWEILGRAREALDRTGHTPASLPLAFEALYAAEGSDWFWWFGEDQGSTWDAELDELFRSHVRRAYLAADLEPPAELDWPIAARLRPASRKVCSAGT
ncbi:MAG TPA: glycoside hydrolase family 57 protein [Polyangiaceae bacterium]|nr:glycoside hydrolase family 57 protein [Polyangiaceae bacterium]